MLKQKYECNASVAFHLFLWKNEERKGKERKIISCTQSKCLVTKEAKGKGEEIENAETIPRWNGSARSQFLPCLLSLAARLI